jgi:hypothetical protein
MIHGRQQGNIQHIYIGRELGKEYRRTEKALL